MPAALQASSPTFETSFFFATIFVHTSFLIFNPHLLFEDDGSDQYDGASSNIHAALKQKRTLPRRLPNG